LQLAITELMIESQSTFSKQTFYRKSFARAKGIINEVRDVADGVTSLSGACKNAVQGLSDVEEVMSHSSSLRSAIARLISATETKLDATANEHVQLAAELRQRCNEVTRASKQLTLICEQYNIPAEGDEGRRDTRLSAANRTSSLPTQHLGGGSRNFSTPTARKDLAHGIRTTRMASLGGSGESPMSEVRRRTMLLEQQSQVYRLERQLADAQRGVRNLHKSDYGESTTGVPSTTDI
jgi:hypothetical protein